MGNKINSDFNNYKNSNKDDDNNRNDDDKIVISMSQNQLMEI